jgi:putative transposase
MPVVLFVHLTWKTFRNMPMLGRSEACFLERFLPAEAQRHGAVPLALGMVSDHVHMVVRLPGRFDLPRLAQGLKGASARLINKEQRLSTTGVRWATGYSAYSISRGNLKAAIQYVHDQPLRHPDRAIPKE